MGTVELTRILFVQLLVDGSVKLLDIEARRDTRLSFQNDLLKFLEDGFCLENRDILFTSHDSGVHFRLCVRTSVFDRRCKSADTVAVDIEANILVRLAFRESDQERRRDL